MDNSQFTIEKSQVECYKIKHPSGLYWATITLDVSGPGRGRIQIASDYGNWQNFWGAGGKCFKVFLCSINIEYAAGKFGADRHFDSEATIRGFKNHLKFNRYEVDADTAKKIKEQYTELWTCDREQDFLYELRGKSELMRLMDFHPELCYGISPQFKNFWKGPWKVFIDQLKKEVAEQEAVCHE